MLRSCSSTSASSFSSFSCCWPSLGPSADCWSPCWPCAAPCCPREEPALPLGAAEVPVAAAAAELFLSLAPDLAARISAFSMVSDLVLDLLPLQGSAQHDFQLNSLREKLTCYCSRPFQSRHCVWA